MLLIPLWLVCIGIAILIAYERGASIGKWALIGFLLGPIGAIWAFASAGKAPHRSATVYDIPTGPKAIAFLVAFVALIILFTLATQPY